MYASTADHDRRPQVQALAERLYRERYDYLLRIAVRHAANREDAEEAVQFAFLAFLGHFDPDGGAPPLAWLTLTLKRECWARYRYSHEHLDRRSDQEAQVDIGKPRLSVESNRCSAAGPEEVIERAERVVEARTRLACLKPAERRALVLIAAGYSYVEIGAMNGWTYTKTNRCAAEGRARLRELARRGSPAQ